MRDDVLIIPTGAANLASVVAAFHRLGVLASVTAEPERIASAVRVVLPGVGAFAPAMARLIELKAAEPLLSRVHTGRPMLAICLGMQLLGRGSQESPGCEGLGAFPYACERYADDQRVPQMGWNDVQANASCRFLRSGQAYFANSYRIVASAGYPMCATSEYGGEFIAAFELGSLLACQFHPELSGTWGLDLLDRWLKATGGAAC